MPQFIVWLSFVIRESIHFRWLTLTAQLRITICFTFYHEIAFMFKRLCFVETLLGLVKTQGLLKKNLPTMQSEHRSFAPPRNQNKQMRNLCSRSTVSIMWWLFLFSFSSFFRNFRIFIFFHFPFSFLAKVQAFSKNRSFSLKLSRQSEKVFN